MSAEIHQELIELIFTISRHMRENMSFDNELTRLSIVQIHTLIFLKQHKSVPMGEIAEHFKIEMPSATSLLNKLYSMSLVERQSDPHDRRIVRILLTKSGEKLLEKAMKEREKKITYLLAHLSDEDEKDFLRILQTISLKLEKK